MKKKRLVPTCNHSYRDEDDNASLPETRVIVKELWRYNPSGWFDKWTDYVEFASSRRGCLLCDRLSFNAHANLGYLLCMLKIMKDK